MLALSFRWLRAITLVGIAAATLFSQAAKAATEEDAEEVELFAAIKSGQAEVRVIPRDSTVLNFMVRNTTDRPLRLQMPAALAAAPIQAQQPFPNLFQNNNNNNGGGGGNQGVGFNPGGQNNNNNGPFNPFMNVPAGREVKLRVPCVCLEHGKPEPNTRVAYELRPLSDYSSDRRVVTAIASLGEKNADQRVVQLAVWNMVNEKSWSDLASMHNKHLNGTTTPLYEQAEVEKAKSLVSKLDELQASASATADSREASASTTSTAEN
jgi:hypothetical protein